MIMTRHFVLNVPKLSAIMVFSVFFMSLFSSRGLNLAFIMLACMGGWNLRREIITRWQVQTHVLWKLWLFFLAFALLSAFWAEDPHVAVQQAVKVLLLTTLGWMWVQSAEVQHSDTMCRALRWGIIVGFLGVVIDNLILGGASADYRQVSVASIHAHIAILMLLCFWCILPTFRHAALWVFPGALLLCCVGFLCDTDAVKGAALLGMLVFYATWVCGRKVLWILMPCLVVGILGGPFWISEILHHEGVASWIYRMTPEFGMLERLSLYDWASQRFLEHPWIGHGWANTKAVMFKHPVPVIFAEIHPNIARHESMGINVHNIFLQTAVELGLLGLIGLLWGIIVCCYTVCMHSQSRLQIATQMAFITSVLFISSVSMTLFSTWWLMAVFFFIPFIKHRRMVFDGG